MGSYSIPLSGLSAAQLQLQNVSNNLANMNTDGYKDHNLTFGDLFAQTGATNGAGNPLQTGSGVRVSSTVSTFTQGNLFPTGIASNMALSGNGFFITQGVNGQLDYTRSGDFTTNSAGQITTPNGELVLGYSAAGGVVNSTGLQPLRIDPGVTTPAVASTMIGITANLNSDTVVGGTTPNSSLSVFDSLGSAHTVSISYTKTAANTWTYTVTMPSADIVGGKGTTTTIGSGTLNFNSAGALTSTTGVVPIKIPALKDGATFPPVLTGPFGTATSPTITQTATPSVTSATSTDGYTSGSLTSYSVQPDGTIQGHFSNLQTLALGQVAVASFANTQGLAEIGNSNYQPTAASGSAVVGLAGTGGRGTVVGGSVEASNVDVAGEFAKLIVAQQAYSANAKSITTLNQVSQATLAMIQ